MTREEHIIYAKNLRVALNMTNAFSAETMESLDTAIKALEQKSNDDCVSRQVAADFLRNHAKDFEDAKVRMAFKAASSLVENVNNIPSVTPTQRWIPVNEKLPEEMGTYMTTIDYGEHGLVTGQRYYYGRGLKWNDECVIAWQPLPEPYKEMEVKE